MYGVALLRIPSIRPWTPINMWSNYKCKYKFIHESKLLYGWPLKDIIFFLSFFILSQYFYFRTHISKRLWQISKENCARVCVCFFFLFSFLETNYFSSFKTKSGTLSIHCKSLSESLKPQNLICWIFKSIWVEDYTSLLKKKKKYYTSIDYKS